MEQEKQSQFTKGVLTNSDRSTFKNKTILLKYKRNNRKKILNFLFTMEQEAGLKEFLWLLKLLHIQK